MEKITKFLNKNQKKIFLLLIFISMLILNFLTPLLADDYSYGLNLDGKRISSVIDIFNYQIWHYFNWGGRTIAHTFAQTFLIFPKVIFNVLNSIIYTILIYLIYLHGKLNRKNKDNPYMLLLIHFILWFMIPVFGQSFIWLIGSCNYLWTTVIILYFLWLYRKNSISEKWYNLLLMFILGLLAGWTNENTSGGLIIILISSLIINKVEKKNFELSKSRLFGIIGTLVGFAFMICAPGNYVRNAEFKDDTFIIIKMVRRALDITNNLENIVLPLLIAIIILISLKIYHKKKIEKESYTFILGGFAATYAMVLSPTFPERAWTGAIIFFVIAITILAFDLDKINRLYKFVLVDLCIILSVIYIGQYINLARDINDLRHTWNYRAKVINNSNKNKMFKFYKYVTIDSKNPAYGLNDIGDDSKVWPNNSISKYYGIKGIKAKQ
ncbi:MAG: DUF6056 family protein [Bacilli bacterium]|nr:DUF6056 family protein [Bacilli bacterium]